MNEPADGTSSRALHGSGIAVLLAALILSFLIYDEEHALEFVARLRIVVFSVGPLLIAGCVLLGAGAIVDAIRRRQP